MNLLKEIEVRKDTSVILKKFFQFEGTFLNKENSSSTVKIQLGIFP
ncbi:hypothetical protein SAMN04488573_1262 [Bacillus sp. 5mfcol3.1]|nr:hypothetical protein SAMN04488573_1262 [Bacillus sp. 5mfcol3.1]